MSSQRIALRHFSRRAITTVVTGVFSALLTLPAPAAILDEMQVTAQKREQDIQDVGISVSAFSGDQMRVLGIEDSFDIAMFVPNVNISGNLAGQNTQFSIRGVTQNDFNDIIEAPVAVYLDEGYIPIAQGQTFAVYDIERVEVLKGPQSTLFGRNATGGVVQYLSRQPNMEEFEGYVDGMVGQYDTDGDPNYSRITAALSGPFGSNFAGRIAGMYYKTDGYLKNLYRGTDAQAQRFGQGTIEGPVDNSFASNAPGPDAGADLGETETSALRGILQWEPSDSLRFTLSGNYAASDVATGPYQSKPTAAVYGGNAPSSNGFYPESAGELVNVIDQPLNSSNRSFCSDGSDCGSDQDNDGVLDNFFGAPGSGAIDLTRVNNMFQPTNGGDFFGYRDPDGEDWTFSGDFAFGDSGDTETTGAQLRVEWDFGNDLTLTSITDFKNFEKLLFIDVDSAPVNQSANYAGVDADSLTQEFRIDGGTDRLNWVAGFYYLYIDSTSVNGLKFPAQSVVVAGGGGALGGTPFDLGSDAQLETNSYSLFGQADYELVDKVTLIGGIRVIREEKDYWFQQGIYASQSARTVHQGAPIVIGPDMGMAFTSSPSDTLWAGKLQVDYRPNDDWLLYAGINRGVKAGSFNAQLAGGLPTPVSAIPYDDETLHSFETGFKSTWAGGTTRFNGTFFYYDYKDYQAFLFSGVSGIVINADAETYGFEFEVQSSPIDGLDLLLSAGWFDSTVENVPLRAEIPSDGGAPCTSASPVICRDVKPVYAPETQIAGLARYEWGVGRGMMNIQGDFTWSDEAFYNLRNFDADKFDSYTLVNAIIGWTSPEEAWNVSLAGRNLTDEFAGIQGFDLATLCGCNEVSFRQPRRVELGIQFSF
ncbi:MAG: TonB-dependent receptor [Gammaproteobacteria bacterium]